MPGWNGMGPRGMGPMTGRGMGLCASAPNAAGAPLGMGMGMGMGMGGRGRRNMFHATGLPGWCRFGVPAQTPPAGRELDVLTRQAEALSRSLEAVRARIKDLEADKAAPSA